MTTLSIFVLNITTLFGLGLGVDYSLFIVSRFREELGRGRSVDEAVAIAIATAGRAVAFSGLTVSIGLFGLTFFSINMLHSVGIGGILVVAACRSRRNHPATGHSLHILARESMLFQCVFLHFWRRGRGNLQQSLRVNPRRTSWFLVSPLAYRHALSCAHSYSCTGDIVGSRLALPECAFLRAGCLHFAQKRPFACCL